eukprot:28664-Chlamydomonas_euryale.AAC.1
MDEQNIGRCAVMFDARRWLVGGDDRARTSAHASLLPCSHQTSRAHAVHTCTQATRTARTCHPFLSLTTPNLQNGYMH